MAKRKRNKRDQKGLKKAPFFSPKNTQITQPRDHYSKPDNEQIIAAMFQTKGILSGAAKILGCERKSLYNWMEQYPELAEALKEAREQRKDFYESKLDELAEGVYEEHPQFKIVYKKSPNFKAIELFLLTHAKDRGYVKDAKAERNKGDEAGLFDQLFEVINQAKVDFIDPKKDPPIES